MNTLVLWSDVYLSKIQDGRQICVLLNFNQFPYFVPIRHEWTIVGSKIMFGESTKSMNILVLRFGHVFVEISKMAAIYVYCPILTNNTSSAVFGMKGQYWCLRLLLGNQRCQWTYQFDVQGLYLSKFQNGRPICVLRNINQIHYCLLIWAKMIIFGTINYVFWRWYSQWTYSFCVLRACLSKLIESYRT